MKKYLPVCSLECINEDKKCDMLECRKWIDFEEDNNCSLISIHRNGSMTLKEVSKRLQISLVRASQIEKQALKKLLKRIKFDLFE